MIMNNELYNEILDKILSQAEEIYSETYNDAIMSGGSDPDGNAEYARERFLKRHGY